MPAVGQVARAPGRPRARRARNVASGGRCWRQAGEMVVEGGVDAGRGGVVGVARAWPCAGTTAAALVLGAGLGGVGDGVDYVGEQLPGGLAGRARDDERGRGG